jgi:hypothetical protein
MEQNGSRELSGDRLGLVERLHVHIQQARNSYESIQFGPKVYNVFIWVSFLIKLYRLLEA